MKKRIFLLCCIVGLLWPTAVYAETAQTSQKSLPQVLRIEDYRYLYITQPTSVKEFCDLWEQWWKTGKPAELGYGECDYDITLFENENSAAAAKKRYLVYERQNKLAVENLSTDPDTGKLIRTKEVVSVSPEIMKQILQKLEWMYGTYYIYDSFDMMHGIDLAEINELGMVLNKDMYVFQNAFIDANGILLVSLEDWNTIFATQYGNSKNLAYQNGTIKNNYLSTSISCQNINGKVYVPLREAVNHFGHLSMGWDKQMRKAVVAETSVVDMQKKIRAGQNF